MCGQWQHRKKFWALLFAFLVVWSMCFFFAYHKQSALQRHLAQEVLRFHVLANSDSRQDQLLKLEMKDAILQFLKKEMPKNLRLEQTVQWVQTHVEEIRQVGQAMVFRKGYRYPVKVSVTTCCFPRKTYGDITFPKGKYKAFRVEIGRAAGKNWWCVLYPNLCFLDALHAVVPEESKEKLRAILPEEEYLQLFAEEPVEIKSCFLEWIEKYDGIFSKAFCEKS